MFSFKIQLLKAFLKKKKKKKKLLQKVYKVYLRIKKFFVGEKKL